MTQAVLDYPDDTRTFASARSELFVSLAKAIVAPDVSGVLGVGNMHSIGILAFTQASHITILFEWLFDQAGTQLVTSDTIEVRNGATFDQTITTKGAFLRITVTPSGGGATYTCVVSEAPFEYITQKSAADNVLFSFDTVTVPAGTTSAFVATRIVCAPAIFFGTSIGGTTWTFRVQYIDIAGNPHSLLRFTQVDPLAEHQLYLPAAVMRVTIQNADGVDRNYFCSLAYKPLYP